MKRPGKLSQAGQVLALTLVMTGVGAISTGSMLLFVTTATRTSGFFTDSSEAFYATASGIELVMADLVDGVDILDAGYTPPSIDLNGVTGDVTVTAPLITDLTPKPSFRYIDPGVVEGLTTLASGDIWSVKLNGVEPLSTLFVNWAYITGDIPNLQIRVRDSSGQQIATSTPAQAKDVPVALVTSLGTGDTYTVEFENPAAFPVPPEQFNVGGGLGNTWIFVKLTGKPYLVTSRAGLTGIRAYLRQIPGPGSTSPGPEQAVVIESWQPAPPVTPTPTP